MSKVLKRHNGRDNGSTSNFFTNFYYEVDSGGLFELLQVLSDSYINPLFSEDQILKEIRNVNSEVSMRMTYNEELNYYKILKEVGNQKCNLFNDGFGNIKESQIDVKQLRQKIRKFHRDFYVAALTTLVVITDVDFGRVSDAIADSYQGISQEQVSGQFANLLCEKVPPFGFEGRFLLKMNRKTEGNLLTVLYNVSYEFNKNYFSPFELFEFLMLLDYQGGFCFQLKQEDLVVGLSAEVMLSDHQRGVYLLQFQLTKNGLERPEKILALLNDFLRQVANVERMRAIQDALVQK
jgi:secreted Zn-dependent insulinase-like peptidase